MRDVFEADQIASPTPLATSPELAHASDVDRLRAASVRRASDSPTAALGVRSGVFSPAVATLTGSPQPSPAAAAPWAPPAVGSARPRPPRPHRTLTDSPSVRALGHAPPRMADWREGDPLVDWPPHDALVHPGSPHVQGPGRSLTIDALAPELGQAERHGVPGAAAAGTAPVPGGAPRGAPRGALQHDPWSPSRSELLRGERTPWGMRRGATSFLPSVPGEGDQTSAAALQQQQENAEAAAAIALGDEDAPSGTELTMSPADLGGALPAGSERVPPFNLDEPAPDAALADRMRAMTIPDTGLQSQAARGPDVAAPGNQLARGRNSPHTAEGRAAVRRAPRHSFAADDAGARSGALGVAPGDALGAASGRGALGAGFAPGDASVSGMFGPYGVRGFAGDADASGELPPPGSSAGGAFFAQAARTPGAPVFGGGLPPAPGNAVLGKSPWGGAGVPGDGVFGGALPQQYGAPPVRGQYMRSPPASGAPGAGRMRGARGERGRDAAALDEALQRRMRGAYGEPAYGGSGAYAASLRAAPGDMRVMRLADEGVRLGPLGGGVPLSGIDAGVPLGMNSSARGELRDMLGHLVEISTDQHGSRLIQEKLDRSTAQDRDLVFQELFPEARRLMTDVFGNYVIQKLFEYGSAEQVHALGEQLRTHVLSLSLGTYGCRVVQKAFEHVDEEQKVALGCELEPYVLECVRDQNANHVIQKMLEQLPAAHLGFIPAAFRGHVPALASHCYSCRVLQRIFAYCSEEQRRPLLDEMHQDVLRLMQDQYGNYVVQWVLQHGAPDDRAAVVAKTKTRLLRLARHKFASNVVEQVIEVASPADRRALLDELLAPLDPAESNAGPTLLTGPEPTCAAMVMMQDQYANYVLQRFLQVVQGEDRERLVTKIRPVLAALRQIAHPAPGASGSFYGGGIRLPGGGHIGSKPLLAIERLVEQPPERAGAGAGPGGSSAFRTGRSGSRSAAAHAR